MLICLLCGEYIYMYTYTYIHMFRRCCTHVCEHAGVVSSPFLDARLFLKEHRGSKAQWSSPMPGKLKVYTYPEKSVQATNTHRDTAIHIHVDIYIHTHIYICIYTCIDIHI